jgi:hypothetical protein
MSDSDLFVRVIIERRNGSKVIELAGPAYKPLGWEAVTPDDEIVDLNGTNIRNFISRINVVERTKDSNAARL